MCYLYYTANSGMLSSGQLSRVGDYHNMESLVKFDCLPRLIDAVLCPDGPEVHMLRTWSERLSEERLMAERWLGYSPDELQKRWVSNTRRGVEKQKLFEVALNSEEARQVLAAFRSAPKEPPAYMLGPQEAWDGVQIVRLQRVENRQQVVGSVKPYYDATRTSLEDQHIDFEAGHHTRWGFHGAAGEAIDSIILDPVAGFQPLASGTRGASLWGSGTYFARDAKYVAEGGFCGQRSADGARKMLMCLLMIGMPCLGDPSHKGVLPFRVKPYRYNCTVDSLSTPEIFIMQHPGSALPAYLITFV